MLLAALAMLAGVVGCERADAPRAGDGASAAAAAGEGILIDAPWIRLPPAGAPVAAGYLRLRNPGSVDDRLLGAHGELATSIGIHEMVVEGGLMRMRELHEGLALPAGAEDALQPGGLHLMLVAPRAGLVAGERVPVTLVFERAGRREVAFELRDAAAEAAARDGR